MSLDANKILDSLMLLLQLKRNLDLANMLSIKSNTLSTWRKRNALDYKKIISVCEKYKLDLNYVFLGREKKDEKNTVSEGLSTPGSTKEQKGESLKILKRFRLINVDRNVVLFYVKRTQYPNIPGGSIVIAQRVSRSSIKKNLTYAVLTDKGYILDEFLMAGRERSMLKYNHPEESENDILEDTLVWQVITVIKNREIIHKEELEEEVAAIRERLNKINSRYK